MCDSDGEWGDVDMSACTMRSDAIPILMVEASGQVDASMLINQVRKLVKLARKQTNTYLHKVKRTTCFFDTKFHVKWQRQISPYSQEILRMHE